MGEKEEKITWEEPFRVEGWYNMDGQARFS